MQTQIAIPSETNIHTKAARAQVPTRWELIDRSVGAAVTALFGAVWIAGGSVVLIGAQVPMLVAIGFAAIALGGTAVGLALRAKANSEDQPSPTERAQRYKRFHLINGVQWLCIVALIVSLNLLQRPEWITDGIILIVGLHFLPLARLFNSQSHRHAGLALSLWAFVYPLVAASGPLSPWGAVGAGVILWTFSGAMIALLAKAR